MAQHNLKTWPGSFSDVVDGVKTFEIRRNDREFQVGDVLILKEWDNETKEYTGRSLACRVQYLVQGQYGLPADLCVMGIGGVDVFDSSATL